MGQSLLPIRKKQQKICPYLGYKRVTINAKLRDALGLCMREDSRDQFVFSTDDALYRDVVSTQLQVAPDQTDYLTKKESRLGGKTTGKELYERCQQWWDKSEEVRCIHRLTGKQLPWLHGRVKFQLSQFYTVHRFRMTKSCDFPECFLLRIHGGEVKIEQYPQWSYRIP